MADPTPMPSAPPPPRWCLGELLLAVTFAGIALATFGWISLIALLVATFCLFLANGGNRPAWRMVSEAALIAFVVGLLGAMSMAPRSSARVAMCQNNLKQLGLGFHTYHSTYQQFPPASYKDAAGKPIHSWRVALLPYCWSGSNFHLYRYSEPWDGPNNRLLAETSYLHACPTRTATGISSTDAPSDSVTYFAVVGDNAAFPAARGRKLEEFEDTAHTILILEHAGPTHHWMAPGDLTLDEAVSLLTASHSGPHDYGGCAVEDFFFEHTACLNATMADGSVRRFPCGMPEALARRLLQVRKDRPLRDEELHYASLVEGRPKWANWLRAGFFLAFALLLAGWGWWQEWLAFCEAVRERMSAT